MARTSRKGFAMRVEQLSAALQDIQDVFAAGGARGQKQALQVLIDFVQQHQGDDLGAFLDRLKHVLGPDFVDKSLAEEYLRAIKATGYDRAKFDAVHGRMVKDKRLRKQELILIALPYFGDRRHVKPRDSVNTIMKSLKEHFNELHYEKVSRDNAKSATPW